LDSRPDSKTAKEHHGKSVNLQKRKGIEAHGLYSVPTGWLRKMLAHSEEEPSIEEGSG
jgi:hypothetical protein